METTYWHKQTTDKPLFPNLLWSRPENRQFAGKLLIIGGNQYNFAATGEAYAAAAQAGIGATHVLLPDALQKALGRTSGANEFAPSTPSGSFSQKAVVEFILQSNWADGVLLAGDMGRNSETAIALEKFITTYGGLLTITKDAVDYVTALPQFVLDRPNTVLVLSFAQLQKIATNARFTRPFSFGMDLLRLVAVLHDFTVQYSCSIVVKHLDQIFAASNGEVSSTKLSEDYAIWRVRTAAYVNVWAIQNPSQLFAALTTAIYDMMHKR